MRSRRPCTTPTPNPAIDFASSPFYVDHLGCCPGSATAFRAGPRSAPSASAAPTPTSSSRRRRRVAAPAAPRRRTRAARAVRPQPDGTRRGLETSRRPPRSRHRHRPGRHGLHAACRPAAFRHRRAVVVGGDDRAGAVTMLRAAGAADQRRGHGPRVWCSCSPGQGTQYPGMLGGLYKSRAVRADVMSTAVLACSSRSWASTCVGCFSRCAAAAPRPRRPCATPPSRSQRCSRSEYALAQLWRSWGVQPAAMIGHSVGEYVAATLAGVMSLADALQPGRARGPAHVIAAGRVDARRDGAGGAGGAVRRGRGLAGRGQRARSGSCCRARLPPSTPSSHALAGRLRAVARGCTPHTPSTRR